MNRSALASTLFGLGVGTAALTRLAVHFLHLSREIARPVVFLALAMVAVSALLFLWKVWREHSDSEAV